MKKTYDPKKMAEKSRFRTFYEKWNDQDRQHLLDTMARLIKENPEYADSKN